MIVVKYNQLIKKMKKLIIISSLNFDNYLFKRYQIENYIKKENLNVECWRLKFLDKKIKDKNNKLFQLSLKEESLKKNIVRIFSYNELIKYLRKNKNNFFVYDLNFFQRNILVLILFKIYGAKFIFHNGTTNIPIIKFNLSDYKKIFFGNTYSSSSNSLIFDTLNFLNNFVKSKFRKVLAPKLDIFFSNGLTEKIISKSISKKNIDLHPYDYDSYIMEKNSIKKRIIDKEYILLLDQGYPVPYDNIFSKERPVTTELNYKKNIVKLLRSFQLKFPQKKIVVALHPKSSRQDFYGFESFEYMTPHLVKFSSFILSHDTLSIQLAALWNKPTLLLTSNDLKRRISQKKGIQWFADKLNLPIVNIDSFDEQSLNGTLEKILSENDRIDTYNKFIENYIKSNHPAKIYRSVSETIANEISE